MALSIKYADFDDSGSTDQGTQAEPWKTWSSLATNVSSGDHVYVKQTTSRHDQGSAVTWTPNGSSTQPIILEGYKTTIGDGGDSGISNYMQMGSTSASRGLEVDGHHIIMRYFDWVSNVGFAYGFRFDGKNILLDRCRFANPSTSTGAGVALFTEAQTAVGCQFINTGNAPSSSVCVKMSASTFLYGCVIDISASSNAMVGLEMGNTFSFCSQAVNCIIKGSGASNGQYGIDLAGTSTYDDTRLILCNSIVDVGRGIHMDQVGETSLGKNAVIGNAIYDVTDGIFSAEATSNTCYGIHFLSNAIGGASSDRYDNLGDGPGILPDVTLTANPWTADATDDFSLNATAGGGPLCKGTLEPVDITHNGNDNAADIGAVQDGS
jgi:hypothetical protein